MEETTNNESAVETVNEPSASVTDQNPATPAKISSKVLKQQKATLKYLEKRNKLMTELMAKESRKTDLLLESYKRRFGKEDYNFFKEACTVHVPEVKDENGVVTQKGKKVVNKQALLKELANLLVIKREDRIKAGKRKRSTGRHSKRVYHASQVAHLQDRNKALETKESG